MKYFNHRKNKVFYLCVEVFLLVDLCGGYIGVVRNSNGTDLEIRRLHSSGRCGNTNFVGQQHIVTEGGYCGYNCAENTTSYWTNNNTGLSCRSDEEIRQAEKCYSGSIGTKLYSNQIQVLCINKLSSSNQIVFQNNKQLSRCELKNTCSSIQYRNISSGWQATSLSSWFKIITNTKNFTNPIAEIKLSCSEIKAMEGLLFKIEMACRIDAENKTYDSCFLFKLQGRFNSDDSGQSLDKACTVVPSVHPTLSSTTLSSTTLSSTTLSSTTLSSTALPLGDPDDMFFVPYGIIIIIFLIILIALIILALMYKKRQKGRRDTYDVDGQSKAVSSHDVQETSVIEKEMNGSKHSNSIPMAQQFNKTASSVRPKSVKGFTNPMFVSDEELKLDSLPKQVVEYATVKKIKNKDAVNGILNKANTGIYEEIPHKKTPTDGSDSGGKNPKNVERNEKNTYQDRLNSIGSTREDSKSTYIPSAEEDSLYWKSKALRRNPSVKDDLTPEKTDTSPSRTDKENLNRIFSAKGSFRDVPFYVAQEQKDVAPIYHNSSIPTAPLSNYGNSEARNTTPNFYDDAPLSNTIESLEGKSMVNPSNHDYYRSPSAVNEQRNHDAPLSQSGNKQKPPKLPAKTQNGDSYGDTYDIPPHSVENKYNVIPKIKGDNESVFVNYRRPVPDNIDLKRMPYSQFSYTALGIQDSNGSAKGFCLMLSNYFLANRSMNVEDLRTNIPVMLKSVEEIWNDIGEGNISIDESSFILKSLLRENLSSKLSDEMVWSIEQGIGGQSSFEALHDLYTRHTTSTYKECLIITFYPGYPCVVLFDENGNQIFIDMHVHFKNNQQNIHDAAVDVDCGGVIVQADKRNCDELLNYIITNMSLEMKCNPNSGSAVSVHRGS